MPSTLSWTSLLRQLEQLVLRPGFNGIDQHKEAILSMLSKYQSNESDFRQFIYFDKSGYTKNLVKDIGSDCNVIIMCWASNQSSAFHAHEGSKCFVKVLMGQLIEQQVSYPGIEKPVTLLQNMHERHLARNDVSYIDDSIGAHRVINKLVDQPAITLHIYSPSYKMCRVFETNPDQEHIALDRSKLLEVNYYSKFGTST